MKTDNLGWFLLPLTLSLGCYTGLEDGRGGGEGFGADGAADGADGAGDDDDDDDDDNPPRAGGDGDDGGGPGPDPFALPVDEVELLPFPVRMNNLARVAAVNLDHPMFFKAYDLRLLLGDHDYSVLEAPDLRWSAERMQNWGKAVKPVCESNEMQIKYPNLVADPSELMREAFGRDPEPSDLEPMLDIANSTLPENMKFTLSCMAVLSSLDFVAY